MKKIITILCIIGLYANSYGQDTVFPKHYWAIEGGINFLIPVRQYKETQSFFLGDGYVLSEYNVKPHFTALNFFINSSYSHSIFVCNKSAFSFSVRAGVQHNQIKIKKSGYKRSNDGSFIGKITSSLNTEYAFFDVGLIYKYKIKDNLYFTNQFFFGPFLFFHQYEKSHSLGTSIYNPSLQRDYIYRNNEWYTDVGLFSLYNIGMEIVIKNHVIIKPTFEIPLYTTKTQITKEQEWDGIKPNLLTPYLTSINNLSMLNVKIAIEYIIK